MAQTTISIRMDDHLKHQFEEFCSAIGMSMTTAVCIFAKKAVRERRIPFELTAEPDSSYATKRDVSRRIGAAAGKIVLPANFDQAFAEMDAEIADLFEGNGSI